MNIFKKKQNTKYIMQEEGTTHKSILELVNVNAKNIDKLTKGLPSLIKRLESVERQLKIQTKKQSNVRGSK